jgi:hypothetical protein
MNCSLSVAFIVKFLKRLSPNNVGKNRTMGDRTRPGAEKMGWSYTEKHRESITRQTLSCNYQGKRGNGRPRYLWVEMKKQIRYGKFWRGLPWLF